MKVGDLVSVPAFDRGSMLGRISGIDPRCTEGQPCPCCGRGVSVEPLDQPSVRYAFAPAQVTPMGSGLLLVKGGDA